MGVQLQDNFLAFLQPCLKGTALGLCIPSVVVSHMCATYMSTCNLPPHSCSRVCMVYTETVAITMERSSDTV